MPNKVNIPVPPVMADELREVYSYLWKTVEQLNVCLNQIDEDNLADGVRAKLNRVFALAEEIDTAKRGSDGLVTQLGKSTRKAITDTDAAIRKSITETEDALRDDIEANAYGIDSLDEKIDKSVTDINTTISDLKSVYAPVSHTHPVSYVTGATDTGDTWVGGGKIYRRSIAWSGTETRNETLNIGKISGIGSVIRIDGAVHNTFGSEYWLPLVHVTTNGESKYNVSVNIDSGGNVKVNIGEYRGIDKVNITVWYTK